MDAHRARRAGRRRRGQALFENRIAAWLATGTSVVLLGFAAFCFIAGVWRQLLPGCPPPRANVRRLPVWLLIAFNGFFLGLCVAVLLGFLVT